MWDDWNLRQCHPIYTLEYLATIKDCLINSWGVNAQTKAGLKGDAAIKSDFWKDADGNLLGSLNLSNNYFGLDEKIVSADKKRYYPCKREWYDDNTNGIRVKGTY